KTRSRRIACTSYMVSTYKRRGEWGVVRDTPKAWGVVLDGAQRILGSHRQVPLPTPHSPLPTPLGCKDVHHVRLGEPRPGAAPDHVDPAAQGGRAQTVPSDGQGGADAPAVGRRIVDLVVVEHRRAGLA